MGCGGSKEAPSESIPLEQTRVATARPRTSNRPPTSQNRPTSKRPPSSQRPPSSSNRPSTSSKRPSSSSNRPSSSSNRPPSSSRRTSSGHGGRSRPKSSYQQQPTIYEDNTPEDNDITEGIIILCTLIDQHSESFYGDQYSSYVRRTMGEAFVNHILVGSSNVDDVLRDLSGKLQPYAIDDARREDHLDRICKNVDRIKRMRQRHPSDWSFGPFEQNVWFPSVSQDGVVVKNPDTD